MAEVIFEDLRRVVLGLLFVVAFGWMAALVLPGSADKTESGWKQVALAGDMVPPHP